jgi:hypothetical protein
MDIVEEIACAAAYGEGGESFVIGDKAKKGGSSTCEAIADFGCEFECAGEKHLGKCTDLCLVPEGFNFSAAFIDGRDRF